MDFQDNHTLAIRSLRKFIRDLSHEARWGADPDPARSYLQDVLRSQGPETIQTLSSVRELGLRLHRENRVAEPGPEKQLLERHLATIRIRLGEQSSIVEAVSDAGISDRDLKPRLDEALASFADTQTNTVRLVDALWASGGKPGNTPQEFYDRIANNIQGTHDLLDKVKESMRVSLQAELADAQAKRWTTLGIAVVFIVAAILFAYFVMREITRPLEELVATSDVVASGDLSVHIPFENRKDEIGVLVSSFNAMVFSLNRIVSQVQKSGVQVNTSINQISVTSNEQQAAARQIADTTESIGDTASKISNTSQELVSMMNDAFTVAEDTTELAGRGQEGLTRMRETMKQITDAASLIHTKLDVLNEKAANINQVITTITKIADRTNLLSLNAAIEAEKAGEYGRGFSVVATEIRRLADQTAVATFDIEQMVKEMQAAVTTGVMAMNRFSEEVRHGVTDAQGIGGQLDKIIQQVQALTPRFELVNEGMNSQAGGGQNISDALTKLSRTVQQTAKSLEDSNEAVDQLKNAAYGLRDGVARFKLPR
ncbi:MAG: methyl-accepting chemotaxis protein [Limisphaerales bacterium]